MPLIESLLARLRPAGVTRVIVPGDGARAYVDGKTVAELYAEQPHLRTVVDFIAQNIAQLKPKCYVRAGDTDRRRDVDGALPTLLSDPNPDMTTYELVYSLVADWCLYGRVVWLVGRDSGSASGWQIRPIPPSWITSWNGGDGFSYESITFQDRDFGGGIVTVSTADCVVFTNYRPGRPSKSLSPVESLRQTLAEQIEAQAYRREVWSNATRISGYIARPQGVEWSDGAARRFKEDLSANWSKGGSKAGRTPVLEDGMEYRPVTFSAREGEWAAGVKLSREDCAAAFHVNPAMIWNADGQTYASAKDNARALYADTFMPLLTMVQQRITKRLAPMIGAPANEYVEFDISAKLQGSFEEQTTAMQSSVGAPWRTRNEARAMQNLPPVEGGDELITPLNVLVGGQASPTDSAPKMMPVYVPAGGKSGSRERGPRRGRKSGPAPKGLRIKAEPTDEETGAIADVLRSFYARQRKAVLSAMGAKSGRKADGAPAWWDAERWDRELSDDLAAAMLSGSSAAAKRAIEQMGGDPDDYDEPRTRAYILAWAQARAAGINAGTLARLQAALDGDLSDDAAGSTPAGVFDKAEGYLARQQALTLSTQVAGWGAMEAARQQGGDGLVKTWRSHSSRNPRSSHRRMNGETVPIDEKFSNGADWPGDSMALPVEEVANCHCTVEITREGDGIPDWDPNEDVSGYTADNLDLSALSGKELKDMKRRKPDEWKGYVRLSQLGYGQKLLHEDGSASASFDMLIVLGGTARCADLKTPQKGRKALRKRLTDGYSKWERLYEESAKFQPGVDRSMLGDPFMVVDNRFSEMSDDEAREQISESMVYLSDHGPLDYSSTMLIRKDGSSELVEK